MPGPGAAKRIAAAAESINALEVPSVDLEAAVGWAKVSSYEGSWAPRA
jgi:hypothetical protein